MKKQMRMLHRRAKRAFTLIEILVATVIMVIMVGLVIQITSEVLNVWNRSSGKLSANAEARIAMDLLTQDLETAVLRNNGKQWLRVEAPVDPGGPYTDQTVALKLFSPALDRDQAEAGDICGIAYELNYGGSYAGADDNVYALYRKLVGPKETFDELMGSGDDGKQDVLNGGLWDNVVDPDRSNYLAGNVIEFKVLLYVEDPVGTVKLLNANPKTLELDDRDYAYGIESDESADPIPETLLYADIMLKIISDEAMELLAGTQAETTARLAQTGMTIEQYIAANSETFIRRVNFLARPL
jgi:prepilin-type N-terminal cleavage/methylation domain-containing protein